MSPWLRLVMKVKAQYKCSLLEAMKKAKPIYAKLKK